MSAVPGVDDADRRGSSRSLTGQGLSHRGRRVAHRRPRGRGARRACPGRRWWSAAASWPTTPRSSTRCSASTPRCSSVRGRCIPRSRGRWPTACAPRWRSRVVRPTSASRRRASPDPTWQDGRAPGTVYVGIAVGDGAESIELELDGDRAAIRAATVRAVLDAVAARLETSDRRANPSVSHEPESRQPSAE